MGSHLKESTEVTRSKGDGIGPNMTVVFVTLYLGYLHIC